ncbi:MAG: DUF4159 domain-containing protein [Elusimicrobiota bacterium]|nr:DUF4159 domain-containing protein [Endomicrobiia bacterium]MCX7910389.1 DUF4159 domain-containing protein [Endomicrobiia bacterium]MDW8165068.1 DUF4159 domain-containing protein [Elusimicrobiota bacterium]
MIKRIYFIFVFSLYISYIFASDKFIFAQLKYPGNWDPYPDVYKDILDILEITTSVKVEKERIIIDISSDKLKYEISKVPFVILLGNNEVIIPFKNIKVLRDYVTSGGTIFIEDTSELYNSKFDESIRKILKQMFPEYKLKKTDRDYVLMKSFYLIRKVTGRIAMYNYLEYIEYENRPVIIYSRNNIIACWARDRLGNYIYSCIPGGEQQRFNSQKLFLNIIMYSLCGTYKMDKVHQPYIQERLNR